MEKLIKDLRTGRIRGIDGLPEGLCKRLEKRLGLQKKRAEEIEKLSRYFRASGDTANLYRKIWPRLKLISCWTEANAAYSVRKLVDMLPGVLIQGKGLLATEGFVSFPMVGQKGHVLSICSHFFEFIRINIETGEEIEPALPAHCLRQGCIYSVALTTGGGLYRYRLKDSVFVEGFYRTCPLLKFLGKEDNISDYFGEKLNEHHVRAVLNRVFEKRKAYPDFVMLAPETSESGFRYAVYMEREGVEENGFRNKLKGFLDEIDQQLSENFHYAYCRKLGQIHQPVLYMMEGKQGRNAHDLYIKACMDKGQKLGNIKHCSLHRKTGWTEIFKPIICFCVEKEEHL